MASQTGFIVKNPTGLPTGPERQAPRTLLSTSQAVPSLTALEDGVHGQAIFGGLTLAILAHEATTAGRTPIKG